MEARDYGFDLWARIFCGATIALIWGACIFGLSLDDVRDSILDMLSVAFLFLITLPLVDCMLWRMRVDEHGVSQTVYGWRVLWPWEAFDSGAIEMDSCRSFIRTDWPWWRVGRKLTLTLNFKERDEVLAEISRRSPTLANSIEDHIQRQRESLQAPFSVARFLRVTLCIAIAFAIQFPIALAVVCTWIVIEALLGFEFFGNLDEQERKLFVLLILLAVVFVTTRPIRSLLVRLRLIKPEK